VNETKTSLGTLEQIQVYTCKRFPCPTRAHESTYYWLIRSIIDEGYRKKLFTTETKNEAIAEMKPNGLITAKEEQAFTSAMEEFTSYPTNQDLLKKVGDVVCGIWTCPKE
jgi:hypothetical protein